MSDRWGTFKTLQIIKLAKKSEVEGSSIAYLKFSKTKDYLELTEKGLIIIRDLQSVHVFL